MTPFAEDVAESLGSEEFFEGFTFFDFNMTSEALVERTRAILEGGANEIHVALPDGRYWLETSVWGGNKRVAFIIAASADLISAVVIHRVTDGEIGKHPTPIVAIPGDRSCAVAFMGDPELDPSQALELLALFAAMLEAALLRVKESVQ